MTTATATMEELALDWDSAPVCGVHLKRYRFFNRQILSVTELEPPCQAEAELIVRQHSIKDCTVEVKLMCRRHFHEIFHSEDEPTCPACGTLKYISHRPL